MLSLIMLRMAAEANQREDIEENQPRDDGVLVLWEPPGEMEGDTILTVGSKKIAVNKIYLSQLSDYFRALFYGNFCEREKNEFVIREVDEDEFIEMLLVLLPTRKPIDENNKYSLRDLSDRFIIDSLKERCHWFPLNTRRMAGYQSSAHMQDDVCVIWNAPCGEMDSDTVIEVGKERKKFAVNKVYLAQHSQIFYDMFYGGKYHKSSLTRITADEFEALLRVILPLHETIKGNNIEAVLKASFWLQITALQRECITLLTSSSDGYDVITILQAAFRNNCDELKEYCRTRLPSQAHIDTVRHKVKFPGNGLPKSARRWLSQLYETLPKCAIPQVELERSVRPRVFIDISKEEEPQGRIVMELFSDMEPKAAENFRSLCTGERGLYLYGSPLHLKGAPLYTDKDSVWSILYETIYGTDRLERESSQVVYDEDKPYLLMVSFMNFLKIARSCDNSDYFPIGRVIEGTEVVQSLITGHKDFAVADCGEL